MPDRRAPLIHVLVVDPRRLVREGVCALLGRSPDLRVDGVATVPDPVRADVVVVGGPPTDVPPTAAVVRLDEIEDLEQLTGRVRAAVRQPARPELPVTVHAAALTVREQAVLQLVGRGRSAAEIGLVLGISPRTVERHKQSVVAKLGARNQAHAVARSHERGLLSEVG